MQSTTVTTVPVQNVGTVVTGSGTVGYIQFNDHLATAEQQLVDAVQTLQAANISDLVLDLRYNGGGLLYVASELAYMIAGTVPTAGQTFENLVFNNKHTQHRSRHRSAADAHAVLHDTRCEPAVSRCRH